MVTRRASRGLASGPISASSNTKNSRKFDNSENELTDSENINRLSGAFENDLVDKKQTNKSKLMGGLLSARIMDEPRRRSNVHEAPLLPMKKNTKSVPVKINKKKMVAPPVPESEFDMSDILGTSPITKPAPPKAAAPLIKAQVAKSPIKKKSVIPKEKTPLKAVHKLSQRSTHIFEDEEQEEESEASEEEEEAEDEMPTPKAKNPRKPAPVIKKEAAAPVNKEKEVVSPGMAERFHELQRRFEQLSMLRSTEAEKLLEEFKKNSATRDSAAQKLIDSLKSENTLLKEKLESINRSRRDSNVSVMSVVSTATSAESNAMLNLYRNLSGLAVTTLCENKWSCSLEGRHGAYSFELEFDPEEGEFTYTPVPSKDSGSVWERLPSYLKEEIVFGEGYLQSFFWRALNFLMSQ